MIRAFTIALFVTGFAGASLAADDTSNGLTSAHAQELGTVHEAKQAHNILAHQGYVSISDLERDVDGRWVGTAIKDGKTIFVGVALPHPHSTGIAH
ncbi:MAG: hypothetical protein JNL45_10010 [Hyphomicrobium sp.]|jgi:hypothetical protein|nr:hypothetical protein [Hyphomicrobium sp.]